jgi:transposase-like protein
MITQHQKQQRERISNDLRQRFLAKNFQKSNVKIAEELGMPPHSINRWVSSTAALAEKYIPIIEAKIAGNECNHER